VETDTKIHMLGNLALEKQIHFSKQIPHASKNFFKSLWAHLEVFSMQVNLPDNKVALEELKKTWINGVLGNNLAMPVISYPPQRGSMLASVFSDQGIPSMETTTKSLDSRSLMELQQ
jgi:hypothetical protein